MVVVPIAPPPVIGAQSIGAPPMSVPPSALIAPSGPPPTMSGSIFN